MPRPESRSKELLLLLLALSVLILASPLRALWARDDGSWLLPFVIWAGVTAAAALALRSRRDPPRP